MVKNNNLLKTSVLNTPSDPNVNKLVLSDDFVTGNTASLTIGELRWVLNGGTISYPAGEAHRPGIVRINTGAGSFVQGRIALGNAFDSRRFRFDMLDYFEASMRFNHAQLQIQLSLFGGAVSDDQVSVANSIVFTKGAGLTARLVCRSASTSSTLERPSTLPVVGQWFKVRISRVGTGIEFRYNDEVIGVITNNIPSTLSCGFGLRVMTMDTLNNSFDVDYINLVLRTTQAR